MKIELSAEQQELIRQIVNILDESRRFQLEQDRVHLVNALADTGVHLTITSNSNVRTHLFDIVRACVRNGSLNALIHTVATMLGRVSTTSDLERLLETGKSQPSTPKRQPAGVPKVFGNIPPRNPNFTGRDDLLDLLYGRLVRGTTAVLPEALHGMGGVGKSQLAVEFVYRHAPEYDVIWWIPAERLGQVTSAMVELAQRLGLPVGAEANAVPAVREALRLGQPLGNWLLIFDNADNPEAVRQYFPMGGPGHILVTSRNPQWASVARSVEVTVFRREESVALLTRRTPELKHADANALAEALGDLPLAIEQAAAWLAETGMPAREYLDLFQEKRMELLEVAPPPDYQLPVAAAWNVSLDHLARSRPAALRLLQLCAFFAPEPIARTLLSGRMQIAPELDAALRDPIQLGRAIREINRYGLARIDYAKNTIQMHRLVQAVLMERMETAERSAMLNGAHQLLATNDPGDPEDRSHWPRYIELYPHILASNAAVEGKDPWVRQLVRNEAKFLYYWGSHAGSLALTSQAYQAWRQRLGPSAAETLEIARWLGFMLFKVGRYAEAKELNKRTLELYQQQPEFGDDHEDTMQAIQAVASDMRVEGRFREALELSQSVYDRCIRLFGDEDPLTLNSAHNLAVSLRLVGDFARARDIDEDTYPRKVQVFGQNHEETLRARRGVLKDRRMLGDYVKSRAELEQLHSLYLENLGPNDLETLETARSLSISRRKAGEYELARKTSADTLDRYGRAFSNDDPHNPVFGKVHPDMMAAALNLSLDLRLTGDISDAFELARKNYDHYRLVYGQSHPHTLAAAGNLAIIHRLRDEATEARRINEEIVPPLRDNLGESHILTLSCVTNLASDLFSTGDIEHARRLDQDNLTRYRSALGEDHPSTLAGALNLAIDLRALGQTDEAYALHNDTVTRYLRTLGAAHPATIAARQWERADCDMDLMPL
ncbi:FxSxx-COOH system tetratricopeptide repeat protein [Phytohabitans aurantiacus]|uniref:NB-ARC domain-containing protein n=1 Tax=Phytohabitans aurantiacus TaxID=3016789 RepID=A0ABQ5R1V8_9ACTN|nr:FxSxx-COOH system tetratricopeptide repeat protein [Phytohabitans aurantiacus]GLI00172.1 hypothetical protein Pa4123_54480 [Phytohabitans aurantiacus]